MEIADIAVFVKVVQAGSFTQAAKLLSAPKSTVSAKVAHLERRLGISLLRRTTRQLHLTEEGKALFQTYAQALSEIETAEAAASRGQKTPHGRIGVTAPVDVRTFLAKFLRGFLDTYPHIQVDLILTNRFVDLIGEGVDIAIRAGELRDSSLVARRLGKSENALFAAPTYLKKAGMPKSPHDLKKHHCLRFKPASGDEWRLLSGKQSSRIKVTGPVTVDDMTALKELAMNGHGIALLPAMLCREELAKGWLVPVLPDWHSESTPFSVVYPGHKFQQLKVRLFVDQLVMALQDHYEALVP